MNGTPVAEWPVGGDRALRCRGKMLSNGTRSELLEDHADDPEATLRQESESGPLPPDDVGHRSLADEFGAARPVDLRPLQPALCGSNAVEHVAARLHQPEQIVASVVSSARVGKKHSGTTFRDACDLE